MNRELLVKTINSYFPGVVFETLSDKSESKIWGLIDDCYNESSFPKFDLLAFSKNKIMHPLFPDKNIAKSEISEIQDKIMSKQLPGGVFQYYMDKEDLKFLKCIPYSNSNKDFLLSTEFINKISNSILLNIIENENNISLKFDFTSLFNRSSPTSIYKGYYRYEEMNYSEILIGLEKEHPDAERQDYRRFRTIGFKIIDNLIIDYLHKNQKSPRDGFADSNTKNISDGHLEYNDIYFEIFYDVIELFLHKKNNYKPFGYEHLLSQMKNKLYSENALANYVKKGKKKDLEFTKGTIKNFNSKINNYRKTFEDSGYGSNFSDIIDNEKSYSGKIKKLKSLSQTFPSVLSPTQKNNLDDLYTNICIMYPKTEDYALEVEDSKYGIHDEGFENQIYDKIANIFKREFSNINETEFLKYVMDKILLTADTIGIDIKSLFINQNDKHFYEREWYPLYEKYCNPPILSCEEFKNKMRTINIESRQLEKKLCP